MAPTVPAVGTVIMDKEDSVKTIILHLLVDDARIEETNGLKLSEFGFFLKRVRIE